MTKAEYDKIIKRIYTDIIDPPRDLTARDLALWMDGYSLCHKTICGILLDMQKEETE